MAQDLIVADKASRDSVASNHDHAPDEDLKVFHMLFSCSLQRVEIGLKGSAFFLRKAGSWGESSSGLYKNAFPPRLRPIPGWRTHRWISAYFYLVYWVARNFFEEAWATVRNFERRRERYTYTNTGCRVFSRRCWSILRCEECRFQL